MEDEKSSKREDQTRRRKRRQMRQIFRKRFFECLLWGGMFSLGVLILVVHLTTWGTQVCEESGEWVEHRCVVKNVFIVSRSDSRGVRRYRPEVRIEYTVGNLTRLVQTYSRATLTKDGGFVYTREGALAAIKDYRPGQEAVCQYRKDDPSQVVLERPSLVWGWIFLVTPVTLIIFGGTALVCLFLHRSRSQEGQAVFLQRGGHSLYPTLPDKQLINESPGTDLAFRLPVLYFPTFQFVVVSLMMILWNGISWTIFVFLVSNRESIWDLVLSLLFCLVFCGAGLAFIPWIVALFRTAFSAGTTILEISDHPVVPGRKHRLSLNQYGRLKALSYRISVVCEEVARYRQGTDTITNQKEVFRQTIFSRDHFEIPSGQSVDEILFLKLPIGVMHSMESEHNEIRWTIVVEIEFEEGRKYDRQCPLIVFPYTLRSEL